MKNQGVAAHDRKGALPKGTELTPINPMPEGRFTPADVVRPWDSLSTDGKKLFCRMAEVYAAFSEYTDTQVSRIVGYLEESRQFENTLIFYCADNGASGKGSPNGSVTKVSSSIAIQTRSKKT